MFSKLLVVCLLLTLAAELMEGKMAFNKRKVKSNIRRQPEITNSNIPSHFLCMDSLQQACRSRVTDLEQQFMALSDREAYGKLAQMDLRGICTPVQDFRDCALASYNNIQSCRNADQSTPMFRLGKEFQSKILDFVCDENFEVINRGKSCLLKLTEQDQLAINAKLMMSCGPHIMALELGSPQLSDCVPVELQQCTKNVLAEECGDDIATLVDGLADLVRDYCQDIQTLVSSTSSNPVEQPSIPTSMKRHAREFAKLRKMLNSFF